MSGPIVITVTIWPDTEKAKFECEGCTGDEALEWLAGFVDSAYSDEDDEDDAECETINQRLIAAQDRGRFAAARA